MDHNRSAFYLNDPGLRSAVADIPSSAAAAAIAAATAATFPHADRASAPPRLAGAQRHPADILSEPSSFSADPFLAVRQANLAAAAAAVEDTLAEKRPRTVQSPRAHRQPFPRPQSAAHHVDTHPAAGDLWKHPQPPRLGNHAGRPAQVQHPQQAAFHLATSAVTSTAAAHDDLPGFTQGSARRTADHIPVSSSRLIEQQGQGPGRGSGSEPALDSVLGSARASSAGRTFSPPPTRPEKKRDRERRRRDAMTEKFGVLCELLLETVDPAEQRPNKLAKEDIIVGATSLIRRLRQTVETQTSAELALKKEIRDLREEKAELRVDKNNLKAERDALVHENRRLGGSAPLRRQEGLDSAEGVLGRAQNLDSNNSAECPM